MMRIEYLADRADFIPELARLHFQEWGYLRPEQTLEARTKSLRARCGHRYIPTVMVATIDTGFKSMYWINPTWTASILSRTWNYWLMNIMVIQTEKER
jgi:hypothetical protein